MAGVQRLAESDITKSLTLLANIVESLERYAGIYQGPISETEAPSVPLKDSASEPPAE